MSDEKHIIRKAIVEVHLPAADGAFDAQNKALAYFKEKIIPLIEKIIDNYSSAQETIRIDKLQLDFHQFNLQNTSDGALRKFEKTVEDKLEQLIAEERATHFPGKKTAEIKKMPKEKATEELFFHLLKTGNLPWWAETGTPVTLETLAQKILQQPSATLKKEMTGLITLPSVRKRIAYQLSQTTTEKIIVLIGDAATAQLTYANEFLKFAENIISSSESFRRFLYEYILQNVASSSSSFNPPEHALREFITGFVKEKNDLVIIEKLYKQSNAKSAAEISITIKQALAVADPHFSGAVKKIMTVKDVKLFFDLNGSVKKINKSSQKKSVGDEPEDVDNKEKEANGKEPNEKNDPAAAELKSTAEKNNENSKSNINIDKTSGKKEISINAENIEKNSIDEILNFISSNDPDGDHYIKNSGVIILAVYLPAMFKELELYDGKTFISDEAKERAVYLLQYLITGSEEFEEHELVFNKILCGVEIGAALTLQFTITEKEKEECLNLLQAVADNWHALKGTSGEGMRDAFFTRDGILEKQSNGWHLKIERTTIDILLDKLPWGISVIQMPWSKEIIFVTW